MTEIRGSLSDGADLQYGRHQFAQSFPFGLALVRNTSRFVDGAQLIASYFHKESPRDNIGSTLSSA